MEETVHSENDTYSDHPSRVTAIVCGIVLIIAFLFPVRTFFESEKVQMSWHLIGYVSMYGSAHAFLLLLSLVGGIILMISNFFKGYARGLTMLVIGFVGFILLVTSALEFKVWTNWDYYLGRFSAGPNQYALYLFSLLLFLGLAVCWLAGGLRKVLPESLGARIASAFGGVMIITVTGVSALVILLFKNTKSYRLFLRYGKVMDWVFIITSLVIVAGIFIVGVLSLFNTGKRPRPGVVRAIRVIAVIVLILIACNDFVNNVYQSVTHKGYPPPGYGASSTHWFAFLLAEVGAFLMFYSFFFLTGIGLREVLYHVETEKV